MKMLDLFSVCVRLTKEPLESANYWIWKKKWQIQFSLTENNVRRRNISHANKQIIPEYAIYRKWNVQQRTYTKAWVCNLNDGKEEAKRKSLPFT